MKNSSRGTVALLGIFGISACQKPNDVIDVIDDIAETGGDDGLFVPDVDLPEEGDEPVLLEPGECLQVPLTGAYGYSHQCEGTIDIEINAKGDIIDGAFTFGPGRSNPELWLEPDNYDLPLVAACCGPFNYATPTSEQKKPYINNCLLDAAQQICYALPHLLYREASNEPNALKKAALKNLAADVETMQADCLLSLWGGGPTEDSPTRLENTSWSPKTDITFTLLEAAIINWTVEGDVTWNECKSFYDNDTAVIPTAPFELPGSVTMQQSTLASGTTMTGSGPLGAYGVIVPSTNGSSLTLAQLADGTMRVTGLNIKAGPSTVTINNEFIALKSSALSLGDVMEPRSAGGEHVVAAGDARLIASALLEGDSRAVPFTNDDPIVFRQTSTGAWEFDPFDLSYNEPGIGTWTLSFDGLLFIPPT